MAPPSSLLSIPLLPLELALISILLYCALQVAIATRELGPIQFEVTVIDVALAQPQAESEVGALALGLPLLVQSTGCLDLVQALRTYQLYLNVFA